MPIAIYVVTAQFPVSYNNGRSTESLWGHERQYHATRESAEAAKRRLQASGGYGGSDPQAYSVQERTRSSFPADFFGEEDGGRPAFKAQVHPTTGESQTHGPLRSALRF